MPDPALAIIMALGVWPGGSEGDAFALAPVLALLFVSHCRVRSFALLLCAVAGLSVEHLARSAGRDAFLLLRADALATYLGPLHLWFCAGIFHRIAASQAITLAGLVFEFKVARAFFRIGDCTG